MMYKKKVSIIIPAYNRIKQTLRTIELLKNSRSSGDDFESEIIVSDSSPNNDMHIALAKAHTNVAYTKPSIPGIAAAKNKGAAIAKNDILIFCDSDMEVEPNTLKNTLRILANTPSAGALMATVKWQGGPKNNTLDRPRPEDRTFTHRGTTYIEAIYSRFIATYKPIFFKVGGYDEKIFNMRGEGSDLSVRYWRNGFPLVYSNKIAVHHVHEVEGGIIRNNPHPEWGIAKDLLLLGYKYNMFGANHKNFMSTVAANFSPLGKEGYFRILEGIAQYYNFITEVKPYLDKSKKTKKFVYDFKFLEIFSDKTTLLKCIESAPDRISQALKN